MWYGLKRVWKIRLYWRTWDRCSLSQVLNSVIDSIQAPDACNFEITWILYPSSLPSSLSLYGKKSAMNHCNCWRLKNLKNRPEKQSNVSVRHSQYGNAIGVDVETNSMSTLFVLTTTLKCSSNCKSHQCHFSAISCCQRWHSFELLTATSFFTITRVQPRKWFIFSSFASTMTTMVALTIGQSPRRSYMNWWWNRPKRKITARYN